MAHSLKIPSPNFNIPPNDDDEEESFIDYYYDEPGEAPGTLDLEPDAPDPNIILIDYNTENATRLTISDPEECRPYLDTKSVSWVDIQGLGNQNTWDKFIDIYKLHPIAVEDIVNVPQRPKVVDYKEQLLMVAWMVMIYPDDGSLHKEQVSLVIGKNYLLTIQEEPDYDCFEPVRDRIRYSKGIIRGEGVDYLAYALIDTIIDEFFPVLEQYGEMIDDLEDEVVFEPTPKTLKKIYELRRELLTLRRAVWSHRDALNILIRDDNHLISSEVRIYLRDCYDHTIQLRDMVDTYREVAAGLMDIYLSSVSNKMNQVMKTLTVISSIFIPLTFLAGIYGMNFDTEKSPFNMPELEWYFGYPLCLSVMAITSVVQIFFFWQKGWFKNDLKNIQRD
ncbi:MAG: magnesium/cobalt transporter CorA [Microcoleaceae cyanobacterium]